MHLIIKFKNNGFLYYYFLFLFIIGSCSYGGNGGELSSEDEMEEIDEAPEEENPDRVKKPDLAAETVDESMEPDDIIYFPDEDMELHDDDHLPDISGRWVKLMIFKGRAKPPLIDPPVAWAVMVTKVDMEQNGEELISYNEMCRLKVGIDSALLTPVIPDSFAEALDIVEKNATISVQNGEVVFYQPKIWEVRSCHLEDPENDPLPTDINAHNVFDPDNTNKNGILMHSRGVISGDAEVVQKVSTELNGYIDQGGNIRGVVTWFEDQKVLWTDNPAMRSGAPTYPDGDPNESIFIYKRVDPDWDCRTIRERSAELFPEQALLYPNEFN